MQLAVLPGVQEMLPILAIVLILFGAKKIPELFRGLGEGMKEFKKATRELSEDEEPTPPPAPRREEAPGAAATAETREDTTRAGTNP